MSKLWGFYLSEDSVPHTEDGSSYSGTPPQPPPPYYQGQQTSGYGATTVVIGQPMPTTYITASVNDYMGLAIFACLCCCWPIGLVAIFKANECRESLSRGDVQSAIRNSRDARSFSIISIVAGVLIIIATIVALAVILEQY